MLAQVVAVAATLEVLPSMLGWFGAQDLYLLRLSLHIHDWLVIRQVGWRPINHGKEWVHH